jgi:hypothetical protein
LAAVVMTWELFLPLTLLVAMDKRLFLVSLLAVVFGVDKLSYLVLASDLTVMTKELFLPSIILAVIGKNLGLVSLADMVVSNSFLLCMSALVLVVLLLMGMVEVLLELVDAVFDHQQKELMKEIH